VLAFIYEYTNASSTPLLLPPSQSTSAFLCRRRHSRKTQVAMTHQNDVLHAKCEPTTLQTIKQKLTAFSSE
jgi:hypothetical protein